MCPRNETSPGARKKQKATYKKHEKKGRANQNWIQDGNPYNVEKY